MNIRAVRKTDIILAAVVIIAAFIAVFAFRALRAEGADVVVTADGEEILRVPLAEDLEQDIVTDLGRNHLSIRGGTVRVTEADCPDLICVRAYSGGISHDGETIICLPHRLIVSVEGGEEAEVDAVAGQPAEAGARERKV